MLWFFCLRHFHNVTTSLDLNDKNIIEWVHHTLFFEAHCWFYSTCAFQRRTKISKMQWINKKFASMKQETTFFCTGKINVFHLLGDLYNRGLAIVFLQLSKWWLDASCMVKSTWVKQKKSVKLYVNDPNDKEIINYLRTLVKLRWWKPGAYKKSSHIKNKLKVKFNALEVEVPDPLHTTKNLNSYSVYMTYLEAILRMLQF